MKAKIAEIFQSYQGEGIYVGLEQVFIRFFGCNLNNCRFCDTQLVSFKEYEPDKLLKYLKSNFNNLHSVSLTGGEPLLQKDFLNEFLPLLSNLGVQIYLETNSTLPEALKEIIDYVDIIAMDFKLPSSTGLNSFWNEHKEFLRIASLKKVFVKTVICKTTDFEDLKKAIQLLCDFNKNINFVLQPNSFENGGLLMSKIEEFQKFAVRFLTYVVVTPQMHKLAGIK